MPETTLGEKPGTQLGARQHERNLPAIQPGMAVAPDSPRPIIAAAGALSASRPLTAAAGPPICIGTADSRGRNPYLHRDRS